MIFDAREARLQRVETPLARTDFFMATPIVDGQWLDFYALLDVPVNADEDTIRKRIGKVYAEASANSDHRDFSRRSYYQALVERVLPQCRRVLLDPEWRAKYDRQHILHGIGDPSAQDYVSFIASMRGGEAALAGAVNPDANLPQRVQDEINLARQVVETAKAGAQLELLPSRAVKVRPEIEAAPEAKPAPVAAKQQQVQSQSSSAASTSAAFASAPTSSAPAASRPVEETAANGSNTPRFEKTETAEQPDVETIYQPGEPARAKTLTAKEAADIRRRRNSNPDAEPYIEVTPTSSANKKNVSRVVVGDTAQTPGKASRLVSPTSLNLMVAITGVLLTITIQKFAMTPAQATNAGRMPMVVLAPPEIAPILASAATAWEQTPEGSDFNVEVKSIDATDALKRVSGKSGGTPDAWIPSNGLWAKGKSDAVTPQDSIAQTPMVLIARSDAAVPLRQMFPNHQITSWDKLRYAVSKNLSGGFGLPDPQSSSAGAFARFSMAREWGETQGLDTVQAVKSPKFWNWMKAFEDRVPATAFSSTSMIASMAQATSDRYKWVLGYESDAIYWKKAGKTNLEVFYLPRTIIADYPFCQVNNVRASLEVKDRGRDAFARYLRSEKVQKSLLSGGFRPVVAIKDSSFGTARALPPEEKPKLGAVNALTSSWAKNNE